MKVRTLLEYKGSSVATIRPTARISEAVSQLVVHRIGALVVSDFNGAIVGIVSERDIVWALRYGPECMRAPVSSIMTADLHTATLDSTCEELMCLMTSERVRHVPVLHNGALVGIVSIGDVVNARVGELEYERSALTDYVTRGG